MKRIVELQVDKVAAVDQPANRRRFLVVKSADGARDSPTNPPDDANPEPTGKEDAMKTEELRESVQKMDLSAFNLSEDGDAQLRKAVNDAVEAAAQEAAEAAREEAQAAAADDAGEGGDAGEGDGIDKSELPEPVRKRLEAAEQAEKQATERIQKLEEDRANQIYLAKARELPSLPLEEIERRDTLRDLAAAAPEAYARLEKALTAMQEQINSGDLFKAVGADGEADTGEESRIRKAAEEIRKQHPDLTAEQALLKAYQEDPSAYDAQIGA